MRLYNSIPQGDFCGWGVCGANLAKHLPNHCQVVDSPADADVILAPVVNSKWSIDMNTAMLLNGHERKPLVGYGFNESSIAGTRDIHYLPANWTALACGSSWMESWVRLALHDNAVDFPTATVLQGVDRELFHYQPKDDLDIFKDRFVIGSAGKFEYRKAQDVVIQAFRNIKRQIPEAMLCASWDNLWPQSMATMKDSPYDWGLQMVRDDNGVEFIGGVDTRLIAKEDQVMWRMGPHSDMVNFYKNIDVMLFPNRCEAGTNLPLMEALACGVPCIVLDGHGHEDIVDRTRYVGNGNGSHVLMGGTDKKWPKDNPDMDIVEPCLAEISSALYMAHACKDTITDQNRIDASKILSDLTWDNTAKGLVELCKKVV